MGEGTGQTQGTSLRGKRGKVLGGDLAKVLIRLCDEERANRSEGIGQGPPSSVLSVYLGPSGAARWCLLLGCHERWKGKIASRRAKNGAQPWASGHRLESPCKARKRQNCS